MIALIFFTTFFVILPLGLLCFEFLRADVASQQLRAACDAAALSGMAAMSNTPSGYSASQTRVFSSGSAVDTFKMNSLFSLPFNVSKVYYSFVGTPPPPVTVNQAVLNISFFDRNGNPVVDSGPSGSPLEAAQIKVDAYYRYETITNAAMGPGKAGPLGTYILSATSTAGLPKMDVVLCFDVSGSMDDQTPVTFVKRWWNAAGNGGRGTVEYDVVNSTSVSTNNQISPPQTPLSFSGNIFDMTDSPPCGTPLNAIGPQRLSYVQYYAPGWPATYYNFNPALRSMASGASEVGSPPGNIPRGTASVGKLDVTDVVVNLDGNAIFGGYSSGGYAFNNVATLVEAARGNLENGAIESSAINGASPSSIICGPGGTTVLAPAQPGYQAHYLSEAQKLLSPITEAKSAATNFLQTMSLSADCNFGLVSFSDRAGTSPTDTWGSGPQLNKIDPSYPAGGASSYPLPETFLNQSNPSSTVPACTDAIAKLQALNGTNIADALTQALTQLDPANGYVRAKARRAIILFTDGVPNEPSSSNGGVGNSIGVANASQAAMDAANQAAQAGIPIFCIGLSTNPGVRPLEDNLLGSIANQTGGTYTAVTSPKDLLAAFQSVARKLVELK